MEQFLGKKYKLKSSENFEEYLKFIGIGLISRKTAISVSPVCVIAKNEDGTYSYTMSTTFKTMKCTFRMGEEFTEERADGIKVKSVITVEGNKLIQIQTEDSGKTSKHVREFTPEILTVITTADGWNGQCIRIYEAI